MDTYKVSAPGLDKKGNEGEFSILVRERDSEVIPDCEKRLMLATAQRLRALAEPDGTDTEH